MSDGNTAPVLAAIIDEMRRIAAHLELAAREVEIMRREFEMLVREMGITG